MMARIIYGMKKCPIIIRHGKVTAEMFDGESLLIFEVQKKEVKNSDYERINGLIAALNTAKSKARGKIALSFAYDDDVRELCEIPEVVAYAKKIFEMCPHLTYFLMPDLNAIRAFVLCMINAKVKSRKGGYAQIDTDMAEYMAKVQQLIHEIKKYGQTINDVSGASMQADALLS